MIRLTDDALHQRLKVLAAERGMTVTALASQLLQRGVDQGVRHPAPPRAPTLRTMGPVAPVLGIPKSYSTR